MKSMTGFGRGEATWKGRKFRAEARSLNHKSMDVRVRVPRGYLHLEVEVVKKVRDRFSRGSIELSIEDLGGRAEAIVGVDTAAAKKALQLLRDLQNSLRLPGEIRIDHLLSFRDMFLSTREGGDHASHEKAMMDACGKAMADLEAMRAREGKALKAHLAVLHKAVQRALAECAKRIPEAQERARERVKEKFSAVMGGNGTIDEKKLEQALAYLSEKHDVTEEIERMKSHIEQWGHLMSQAGPVGVKLGFIFQEMARETGTLVAKSGDTLLTRHALEMRAEIEKAKEQVQNVE